MVDFHKEIPLAIIEMESGLRPLTVEPVITPTGAAIWYLVFTGDENLYVAVDVQDMEQYVFYSHHRTTKEWKRFTKEERAKLQDQHSSAP